METELASEISRFLKKLDDGQAPKKKIVSCNFSHTLFSLLDFVTFEDETDRVS